MSTLLSVLVVIAVLLLIAVLCLFVVVFLRQTKHQYKDNGPCCGAGQHSGVYELGKNEELVIVSYPGPERVGTQLGRVSITHDLKVSTLQPIITVTNQTGDVDVVIESWPHEHWFNPTTSPIPNIPEQPQLKDCEQENLSYSKQFPEEGQPGIERYPTPPKKHKVESRPIYSISLNKGQSTSVHAHSPGGWVRLRGGTHGANGYYSLSWCCPISDKSDQSKNGSQAKPSEESA